MMNRSPIAIVAACLVLSVFFFSGGSAKASWAKERAAIEKNIRASVGWALTKDRALLESVLAHDDRISRSGDVAWWSCILDDLGEWDGKPIGRKDTRWTGVIEKRGRAWLIVQMHFSFAEDVVRAEAAAAEK